MDEAVARELLQRIRSRVTVESFDPDRELTDDEIRELVADACEAPSSFNMQHWRFIAVRRPEDKAILAEAAYGQRQVTDAAVTFILLGDLNSVEHLGETLEHAVKSGSLARARAEAWVAQAEKIYTDPQMSRDEAIRSCSLAAMTLMLAAEARGLGVGALVGFDPDRVMREFKINERYLPVMLLAVGHPLKKDERRKDRLPIGQILCFDRGESLPD